MGFSDFESECYDFYLFLVCLVVAVISYCFFEFEEGLLMFCEMCVLVAIVVIST